MIRMAIAVLILELAIISVIASTIKPQPKPAPVVSYCISEYQHSFWPCQETYQDVNI
jgi:hypothetical protein